MMIKKGTFLITVTILVLALPTLVRSTGARDKDFASFKREMMPKVGKRITIEGTLVSGKLGWLIRYKEWGVYVYGSSEKMNALNRFHNSPVEATGTLKHFVDDSPCPPAKACAPEHFFFDAAEVKISSKPQ